jgi:copper type II ascorbate-dependent monooxygenase-like protein
MRRGILFVGFAACANSSTPDSTSACEAELSLPLEADIALGTEAYLCFGFDADTLQTLPVRAIELHENPAAVQLHHVALYVTAGDYPDGPVECEEMPEDAVELYVWAVGGKPLELPDDVGIALPESSRRFAVQVHAIRTNEGPAAEAALTVCAGGTPANLAAWLPLRAPVPALRPGLSDISTFDCRVDAPLHIFSTWPHMHLLGSEFHGTIIRADETREPLIDVVPWIFEDQQAYRVDVDVAAGDALETQCIWFNDTEEYVFGGPRTVDEMCNQSLIVWPAAAAGCAP